MLTLENFKVQWERKFPDISLKHTHFLLAVSGGLDSVGLTYLMHLLGANAPLRMLIFNYEGRKVSAMSSSSLTLQIDYKYHLK